MWVVRPGLIYCRIPYINIPNASVLGTAAPAGGNSGEGQEEGEENSRRPKQAAGGTAFRLGSLHADSLAWTLQG